MTRFRFRAWHPVPGKMFSPEEMGRDELTLAVDGRGMVNVSGDDPKLSQYMTHMVVMQSTGLADHSGREIFEGDIVTNKKETGVVTWHEAATGFDLQRKGHWCLYSIGIGWGEYEVIGNIHQNPDLLETK